MKKRERMKLKIDSDTVCFKTDHETYSSTIEHGDSTGWYLRGTIFNNGLLFTNVGIEDVGQFQREILGYSFDTYCFPSCYTREDVIKLAKALVDYNNMRVPGNKKHKGSLSLRQRAHIKFNFNL